MLSRQPTSPQFSYRAAWSDLIAIVRPNLTILGSIAGMFLFLPVLALWLFAPLPQLAADDPTFFPALLAYYQRMLPGFLALTIVSAFGQVALLALLLDSNRPTVGEGLRRSAPLLLPYLAMSLIVNLVLGTGFALLFLPGLYLAGRLSVVGPVMVAEHQTNPIQAIATAWRYTSGLGWSIVGFMMIVVLLGWIALSLTTGVIGAVLKLALPQEFGPIAAAMSQALGGAGLSLLIVLVTAVIYRQLRPHGGALKQVFQ